MSVTDTAGNVTYVQRLQPSCPDNIAATAYQTMGVGISTVYLWRAEFRIPPGHQGVTGIALVDSGSFIIPKSEAGPSWLVGDDDLLEYDYNKELGRNVDLAFYNTSVAFTHKWEVRLIYTPMSALDTEGEAIVLAGA